MKFLYSEMQIFWCKFSPLQLSYMPKSKECAALCLPRTSAFYPFSCLQNSVFIRAMLKPIINIPPWAANDPDLKMESSILFSSILCSKKSSVLKRETNHRALVRSLKAWGLRFLCARVEESPYSDAVDGDAVKGCAAGREQGMLCASSCPVCSPPNFWRDARHHHSPLTPWKMSTASQGWHTKCPAVSYVVSVYFSLSQKIEMSPPVN